MFYKSLLKLSAIGGLSLMLSGCFGGGMEGTYQCDGGLEPTLEFKSNGSGYLTAEVYGKKQQTAFEYKIDDNKLIVSANGDTRVLTIDGDKLSGDAAVGTCIKQ